MGGVYLSGGPCDGRTVPNTEIQGGLVAYIACGGGYYVLEEGDRRPNGDLIFRWWGTQKPSPPSPKATAHVTQAWTRWMRILGHRGPVEHKRIVKAVRRMHRIAHKR